jgi:hypothetical protein
MTDRQTNISFYSKAVLLGALCSSLTVNAAEVGTEMQADAQMGAGVEAEAMLDAQADSQADAEADSSIQSLSESFLQAEAMAQVQMVAEQEHELRQKERVQEEEKNKFIEIVSDNENELVTEAKQEAQKELPKKNFEANVFETYDANTGLKIEESSVDTLSQSAVKEAE